MFKLKRQIELSNNSIPGRCGHSIDYHPSRSLALLSLPFISLGLVAFTNNFFFFYFACFLIVVFLWSISIRCDCAGSIVYVSNTTKKKKAKLFRFFLTPIVLAVSSAIIFSPGLPTFALGLWILFLALTDRGKDLMSSAKDYDKLQLANENCSYTELQSLIDLAVEFGDFDRAEELSAVLVKKMECS